ncbi:hypothetical protein HPB47_027845 [Ixodes persulcatus]|uniref:Uncharacterized protein n=1 Tax=Ixodes persulcatus TaxID=34615 RepID=A0AC60PUV1_IXOPE|nr:hypothetical protein HPB47_027845 [Ixodes persulcatus]
MPGSAIGVKPPRRTLGAGTKPACVRACVCVFQFRPNGPTTRPKPRGKTAIRSTPRRNAPLASRRRGTAAAHVRMPGRGWLPTRAKVALSCPPLLLLLVRRKKDEGGLPPNGARRGVTVASEESATTPVGFPRHGVLRRNPTRVLQFV